MMMYIQDCHFQSLIFYNSKKSIDTKFYGKFDPSKVKGLVCVCFMILDGYYVAYMPITLPCILIMFIEIYLFIVILV